MYFSQQHQLRQYPLFKRSFTREDWMDEWIRANEIQFNEFTYEEIYIKDVKKECHKCHKFWIEKAGIKPNEIIDDLHRCGN